MRESTTVLLSNPVGAGILALPGAGGDTGLRLPARIACCVDGTAPEAGVALHVGLSPCVCGVRVCVSVGGSERSTFVACVDWNFFAVWGVFGGEALFCSLLY